MHDTLEQFEDSGDDALTNRYFNLLAAFIDKFSLRYDLRRPCILCPTLPGVFASLVRDLRAVAGADPHLATLMKEFEDSVRDLRLDCSDGRIKTCIQKQVNLLEAIGRTYPGVTGTTLGAICDQVGTWPHEKLKAAIKELYGFASDYPGIRHGGTPANVLRAVDMRDMVAMSILLAGFTPYLSNGFNAELVYRGGREMSQFIFLQREWAAVFEAASNAEAAIRSAPRPACFYAHRAAGIGPVATAQRSVQACLDDLLASLNRAFRVGF